ncbi:MAG: sigma-70 family RNA polymerase sigma factor [Gaiellaceae bacterium]
MGGDPLKHPEELIRRVYSYVAYRIGDGPEAEDVTSSTFERALRYRSSFDPAKGSAQAWVLGIARTCIADHFKGGHAAGAEVHDVQAPENVESEALERLTVQAAIARLGERDRELIALRYGADLKVREIAELVGERTNTIEVALHRALARLRDDLSAGRSASEPSASPSEAL